MKTPKEKAIELVNKFIEFEIEVGGQHDGYLQMKKHEAKECAKIAVDEVLYNLSPLELHLLGTYSNPKIEYWQKVKQEIETYGGQDE